MKSNGSMNRIYRLVWSQAQQAWVAVAECTRGRGKQSGSTSARAVAAAVALLACGSVGAAPVGGLVVSGSGTVSQSGSVGASVTTVLQTSANLALNWQSFNIGAAERVDFVQPSASAIAVNRIADALVLGARHDRRADHAEVAAGRRTVKAHRVEGLG